MNEVADARTRIVQATLACVERSGLARTSLEDVAAEAGLSRATVYRYFPGGRDQVISETVTWEVGNFLQRLGVAVADERGLAAKLQQALLVGHRAIGEHTLLQRVLSTEPEALMKELAETEPLLFDVVRAYLAEQLECEQLRPGRDPAEAAEYLTRLFLSYLGSHGRWDLGDPAEVERLVRTQFLAGILAEPRR